LRGRSLILEKNLLPDMHFILLPSLARECPYFWKNNEEWFLFAEIRCNWLNFRIATYRSLLNQ